jgi:hypothetical protein
MCITELATNTSTAATRIGIQSEVRETIVTSGQRPVKWSLQG